MAGEHKVFTSAETQEKLGFITDYVPGLAKSDALICTREDLLARGQALDPSKADPCPEGVDEEFWQIRNGLKAWLEELAEEQGYPPERLTSDDYILGLAEAAYYENACAQSFDFDADGKNDFGVIIAPKMGLTPEEQAVRLTNFPSELVGNAPDYSMESLAMTIWHEARHLAQPELLDYQPIINYGEMPLPYEIDADRGAIDTFLQAIKDGHKLSPDYLQDYIDQRLVGSFGAYGADLDFFRLGDIAPLFRDLEEDIASHTTHLGLDAGGDHPDFEGAFSGGEASERISGMVMANAAINQFVGLNYIHNVAMKELQETGKISPETEEILGPRYADISVMEAFITQDILDTGELSERSEMALRLREYPGVDTDELIEQIIAEVKENGEISPETRHTLSVREHDVFSVLELTYTPMKAADIGAKIVAQDPVTGLAAGQALLEVMPELQNTTMADYIGKVQEYFEKRGDLVTKDQDYLAAKEHFTEFYKQFMPKWEIYHDHSNGQFDQRTATLQEGLNKLESLTDKVYGEGLGIDLGKFGPKGDGVDGIFGDKTQTSAILAQKALGLEPTGVVDQGFMDKLNEKIELLEARMADMKAGYKQPADYPDPAQMTNEDVRQLLSDYYDRYPDAERRLVMDMEMDPEAYDRETFLQDIDRNEFTDEQLKELIDKVTAPNVGPEGQIMERDPEPAAAMAPG